jgi:hypothetical protein
VATDGQGEDIMTTSEIAVAKELDQFLKEYVDSQHCLEILRFFSKYPHARFSGLAVVHALNVNGVRSYIERALKHLIDKGVVKTYIENKVRLYSLTEDEPLSNLASSLAKLDWRQWQLMVKQIYPVPTE